MIRWVPFPEIGSKHLRLLGECLNVAPEAVRMSARDLINGLRDRVLRLFEFDDGLLVVHRDEKRLVIDALACSIWKREQLADTLRRLAADWECDTIQTTVFDERLADAIVSIGGKIESYDITLPVAAGNGK